jgi:superfamily I DNA/RNA helicase
MGSDQLAQVRTLHSIAGTLMRDKQRLLFQDQVVTQAAALLKHRRLPPPDAAPDDVLEKEPWLPTLRWLFVDEAQDLASDQFDLVRSICMVSGASLVMVGDPF